MDTYPYVSRVSVPCPKSRGPCPVSHIPCPMSRVPCPVSKSAAKNQTLCGLASTGQAYISILYPNCIHIHFGRGGLELYIV